MTSKDFKQLQATQKGGPFALVSVPKPEPGPNEVRITMKAIGLNPLDCKQLYAGEMVQTWPAMFGIDGAGIVEAVGKDVTKFKAGDEVFSLFGHGPRAAAFQEIATVPEHFVANKPGNISFEEAASLP
jgi:NADPH:quinone reductase-like Zn-dependent oxidoreductase